MREKRRFAALLAALALAACLVAVPAVATEGTPPLNHTQMPGDATGTTAPQDPDTDPVTPEPVTPPPDPVTPPPSSSSSQEPSSSSSSQEPSDSSQEPGSSSSSSEESSDSSQDPGSGSSSEDPWSGSSQDPSEGSDSSGSSSEYSESEDPWEEPSQSQETPDDGNQGQDVEIPDYEPQTIATPRPAVERPSVSLNTDSESSSQEEEDSGPNYVTFARLNVKGNSMASTLFLGGVASVAAGVVGLVAILLLYLRGRRRYSAAEGILQEIHEAEVRQQPAQGGAGYGEPPAPPPRRVPPGALVPEEVSLYTEEFSVPQEEAQSYQGEYDQYDGYDDYDDYGDYDDYQDPGQYSPYPEQEPAYEEDVYEADYPEEPLPERPEASPPAQEDMGQTRQFDTEEILREALRFTEDDHDH